MVSQPDLFSQMGASPDGSVDHFEDQVRSLQISIQVRFRFSRPAGKIWSGRFGQVPVI